VDICRNPQTEIDLMKTAFVKNTMAGATPRYYKRADSSVNEAEFLDLSKPLENVNGNLGEDALRLIEHNRLDGNYVAMLEHTIQELRETSGNTETSTGSTSGGVTAASAIAALQEASGKGSRDSTLGSYRAYAQVVNLVIENIRQFYDKPRQFRILGQYGAEEFTSYTNAGLQPQYQGMAFGVDMGYRLPVFDIKVSAQKKNVYTKVSQNELAMELFKMGFFNPQMTDQALTCLEVMDFDGKDEIMQKVARNGTMQQKLMQYMQLALGFAQVARPEMADMIAQDIMHTMGGGQASIAGGGAVQMPHSDNIAGTGKEEHPIVEKARSRAAGAAQPDAGNMKEESK
jgi:hypothetical protein